MPANKPTAKLAYIAIMLVAAGFLLMYLFRPSGTKQSNSGQPNPPVTPTAASVEATWANTLATGDAEAIKKALQAGSSPTAALTAAPNTGWTPLHVVSTRIVPGAIAALVAAGASPDAQTPDGKTPVWMAAQLGLIPCLNDLITANASVDKPDSQGKTALMMAAAAAKPDAVQTLLAAGAAHNVADGTGITALGYAVAIPGNSSIAKMLIEAGADPDVADAQGVTPLMRAAERSDAEQVVMLMNYGASPAGKSKDGKSALDRAKSRTDDAGKQVAGVLNQAG